MQVQHNFLEGSVSDVLLFRHMRQEAAILTAEIDAVPPASVERSCIKTASFWGDERLSDQPGPSRYFQLHSKPFPKHL